MADGVTVPKDDETVVDDGHAGKPPVPSGSYAPLSEEEFVALVSRTTELEAVLERAVRLVQTAPYASAACEAFAEAVVPAARRLLGDRLK